MSKIIFLSMRSSYVDDIKGPFLPPIPSRRVPTTNQIKSLKSQLKVMVSRAEGCSGCWGLGNRIHEDEASSLSLFEEHNRT